MRSSHQSLPVENDDDSGTFARAKGCPVRMSIWSRELLLLLIFLGGAGFFVVADRDSRQEEGARATFLRGHDTLLESVAFASGREDAGLVWLGQDGSFVGCGPRAIRMGSGDREFAGLITSFLREPES